MSRVLISWSFVQVKWATWQSYPNLVRGWWYIESRYAYAQSEEDDNDYDNNADESGDEAPFTDNSNNEELDLTMEHDAFTEHAPSSPPTARPSGYQLRLTFHSREIPYLDHLPCTLGADALIRDLAEIRTTIRDESRLMDLHTNMLFNDKAGVIKAVRIFSIKTVWRSRLPSHQNKHIRWFVADGIKVAVDASWEKVGK